MHIVLDARYLTRRQSGVGYYTQHLVRGLLAVDTANRYTCLVGPGAPPISPVRSNVTWTPTTVSFENHLVGDLWLLGYLPFRLRALRADVYHGPAVFLPLIKLGYRTVVTIHDLVSFLFPETVPKKYSMYMRLMTRLAVRSADRIIAVSHATKLDLEHVLHVPADRIVVIHEAVAPEFGKPVRAAAVEAVAARYALHRPYCLFVGNLEPRKNLPRLIEAFAQARARGAAAVRAHQLVLAGRRGWLYDGIFRAVEAHGLAGEVVLTDYVAPADLPALYAGATCFVFPSVYEGFGLPVLEAMACGTPVIASRVGAIPEVAGDAALLVDNSHAGALAAAIETVVTDEGLRAELAARGRSRVGAFAWDDVARRTLAVYESVEARR
jgi:glycosyltransferase involved in cell wall biosynthesis